MTKKRLNKINDDALDEPYGMSYSISDVMIKDHHKIEQLISVILSDINSKRFERFEKTFVTFRWALEKHFLVEEKAIFSQLKTNNEEIQKMVNGVIEQHKSLRKMMSYIIMDIDEPKRIDFAPFKKALTAHKNLEDNELYPILDKELDFLTKQEIINKITKEIS